MRHIGNDAARHGGVSVGRGGFVIHTRPVEADDAADAPLQVRLGVRGGIHGEVSALAVPRHDDVTRILRQVAFKVLLRRRLRRNRAFERHSKILPPAGQTAVRAAEGNNMRSVGQVHRHGGELDFVIEDGHCVAHRQCPKAAAFRDLLKQSAALAPEMVVRIVRRNRFRALGEDLRFRGQVDVRQCRHHEGIKVIGGISGEWKIAAPSDVIGQVGHCFATSQSR